MRNEIIPAPFLATSRGDWLLLLMLLLLLLLLLLLMLLLLLLLLLLLEWASGPSAAHAQAGLPKLSVSLRGNTAFLLVLALRRSLILYKIGRSILSSPAHRGSWLRRGGHGRIVGCGKANEGTTKGRPARQTDLRTDEGHATFVLVGRTTYMELRASQS
jgi:hypothetical protein